MLVLEAAEGNYTEAALGAISLTPMGRIARLAGLIYNTEQLLDLIGHGHIDEKDKSKDGEGEKEPSKPANGDSSPEIQGQGSDDETGKNQTHLMVTYQMPIMNLRINHLVSRCQICRILIMQYKVHSIICWMD